MQILECDLPEENRKSLTKEILSLNSKLGSPYDYCQNPVLLKEYLNILATAAMEHFPEPFLDQLATLWNTYPKEPVMLKMGNLPRDEKNDLGITPSVFFPSEKLGSGADYVERKKTKISETMMLILSGILGFSTRGDNGIDQITPHRFNNIHARRERLLINAIPTHTDNPALPRPAEVALLISLRGNASTFTHFYDPEEAYASLSEEERRVLEQKIFFGPSYQNGKLPIFERKDGRLCMRWNPEPIEVDLKRFKEKGETENYQVLQKFSDYMQDLKPKQSYCLMPGTAVAYDVSIPHSRDQYQVSSVQEAESGRWVQSFEGYLQKPFWIDKALKNNLEESIMALKNKAKYSSSSLYL